MAEETNDQKTPAPVQDLTTFAKVERVTAWILIGSAILFATVGILAIWGLFDDSGDVVGRSLGSLAVIALAALVINVGARMAEGKK
ncbi:MAG TPA: hypothetical protein VG992_03225 [Candidatus Saccharimonadales bacterium]|nr:hypothetical protein [Candidatus Saccharimonadales bacterium]